LLPALGLKLANVAATAYLRETVVRELGKIRFDDLASREQVTQAIKGLRDGKLAQIFGLSQPDLDKMVDVVQEEFIWAVLNEPLLNVAEFEAGTIAMFDVDLNEIGSGALAGNTAAGQAIRQRFPRLSIVARAIDPHFAFWRATKFVRFHRNDVDVFRIVRIYFQRKPKIGRHAISDVVPRITAVIAAIESPVILQEYPLRVRRVAHDLVHTLSPFRKSLLRRQELRAHALVPRLPVFSTIIRTIDAPG